MQAIETPVVQQAAIKDETLLLAQVRNAAKQAAKVANKTLMTSLTKDEKTALKNQERELRAQDRAAKKAEREEKKVER